MKALAIMDNKPSAALPGIKPITELDAKYKDIMKAPGFFYGIFVKKGTPDDVVKKLTEAFMTAYKDPKFQEFAQKNGMNLLGLTGDAAKKYMKEWQSQMAWLMFDAGGAKESPEKFNIPKPGK